MIEFLSSSTSAYKNAQSGRSHGLFEAVQLVFSHLVLHPSCRLADGPSAPRGTYDLSIVYLLDKPLVMICDRVISGAEVLTNVNFNALLHIRNFWQSHLADRSDEKYTDVVITYQKMGQELVRRGHAPQPWDRPIQQSSAISSDWFGHYSCTHPSPRRLADIEEYQSCAQDWIHQFGIGGVHPLTLNVATTSFIESGWWPPIFSTVPLVEDTTLGTEPVQDVLLLRGIAPFLSPSNHPDLYPAYNALRVRGLIHPLPDQESIPGWKRILMVLYKPRSRYLLAVLDENAAENEDDEPFGQINQLDALIPSSSTTGPNQGPAQAPTPVSLQNQGQVQPQTLQIDLEAEEKIMKEELESREELKGPFGPMRMTRDFIAEMEDKLHPPEELSWEDINYAYLYEGIIIPGGKIMMGRYWRFGAPTANVGFELGDGADRGPWIFWC